MAASHHDKKPGVRSKATTLQSDKFVLRLPDGLRDMLKMEAEKNGRSMNAEIITRIDFSFENILLSNEDMVRTTKRLSATADAFDDMLMKLRDLNKSK